MQRQGWLLRRAYSSLLVLDGALDFVYKFGGEFLDIASGFYVRGGLGEDFLFCFSMSFEGTSGDEVVAVQDFGHGSPLGLGEWYGVGDFVSLTVAALVRNSRFPLGMTERKARATAKATTGWDLWFPPLTQIRGQGWGTRAGGWDGKKQLQRHAEFALEICLFVRGLAHYELGFG